MTDGNIKLPEAFCQRMQELLGEEAEDFFSSYGKEREYGLRYNPLKFSSRKEFEEKQEQELGCRLSPVPWCAEGYYYHSQDRPGRHPWHEAGAFYIQEPSAMSAVELLDVRPGQRICDLCAAPGGKTSQIAGKMQGQGLLVSNEFYASRAKVLAQNIERMGIANAVAFNETTEHLAGSFPGFFDRILVDAPCSGEGMFRKEPESALEWSPENVALCAKRQQEILCHAAKMLKPGGILVYSTCTFAPEENEQNICRFVQSHPEFALEEAGIGEAGGLAKTYRLWPHKMRGEGHFLARMRKAETAEDPGVDFRGKAEKKSRPKRKAATDRDSALPTIRLEDAVSGFLDFQEETLRINLEDKLAGRYALFSEQLYRLPEGTPDLAGLKIARAGLHLGTCKKNRFEPSHALALYLRPEEVKQCVSLAGGDPLKYLHGETVSCGGQKGWTLVCVDGLSLGWGKAQGQVVKNHYPKGLRICY